MKDSQAISQKPLNQTLDGPIAVGMRWLCPSMCDRLRSQKVSAMFFKSTLIGFKNKLPAGSKFLVGSNGGLDMRIIVPYGKYPLHWQKLDLVGATVSQRGHCVAYIKREGAWYLANDASVFKVSEKEVERLLKEGRSTASKKSRSVRSDRWVNAIYEARN